jgi:hypothetical protein
VQRLVVSNLIRTRHARPSARCKRSHWKRRVTARDNRFCRMRSGASSRRDPGPRRPQRSAGRVSIPSPFGSQLPRRWRCARYRLLHCSRPRPARLAPSRTRHADGQASKPLRRPGSGRPGCWERLVGLLRELRQLSREVRVETRASHHQIQPPLGLDPLLVQPPAAHQANGRGPTAVRDSFAARRGGVVGPSIGCPREESCLSQLRGTSESAASSRRPNDRRPHPRSRAE